MFCDVVLPRSKLDALTYRLPDELAGAVRVGSAVRVTLRGRELDGVVTALRDLKDLPGAKPVLAVVEPEFCGPELLRLTRWVSRYYFSSWGEALTVAMPSGIMGYKPRQPWAPGPVSVVVAEPPTLTLGQMQAVRRILEPLRAAAFRTFLLFGVTGSGKTEIYLRAVEETLRLGRAAIVLVPEIALTPLLISRFSGRFPGRLVALHSGLRDAERRKCWQALRDGKVQLVIGARSAVFAPVRRLGLIVVDEEHDSSYKEQERAPHYSARDVAVMRGKLEDATVVLASATPAIESFYNARRRAYELLQLPERVAGRALPRATVVSLRGHGRRAAFTPALVKAIKSRMGTSEQAILFVGRRGFAGQVVCTDCGFIPCCRFCRIPLVYHADRRTLECHFCRETEPAPDNCPACKGSNLDFQGIGTQQAVEQLGRLVPGARILRLDSDVVKRAEDYQRVLGAFEQGEAKFLVGAQMVTKGHDFPNVTLCAAVSADALLNMPDFRSAERTFQVLTQVAGRAGRGDRPGQAFFQTLHPEHYAVVCAARQDYVRFYETELEQRRALAYPPFSRLALVRIMARDPDLCQRVGEAVKQQLGEKVQAIGPVPAFRKKRRENHIFLLLLRARPGMGFSRVLSRSAFEFPRIRVDIDIDPVQVA